MYLAIDQEILKTKGILFADTVQEGFERYKSMIIAGSEKQLLNFLTQALGENAGTAYVDFYYGVITAAEQARFRQSLTESELIVLQQFQSDTKQVFYELTSDNLAFLHAVTARNQLFSSFYFGDKKAIVWGNYDGIYPVFCEQPEELKWYQKLAVNCGLEIRE